MKEGNIKGIATKVRGIATKDKTYRESYEKGFKNQEEIINKRVQGTMLHFKSPTAERRHASCVGGWRGSNPRRPAPMEQGMRALTSRLLQASIKEYKN